MNSWDKMRVWNLVTLQHRRWELRYSTVMPKFTFLIILAFYSLYHICPGNQLSNCWPNHLLCQQYNFCNYPDLHSDTHNSFKNNRRLSRIAVANFWIHCSFLIYQHQLIAAYIFCQFSVLPYYLNVTLDTPYIFPRLTQTQSNYSSSKKNRVNQNLFSQTYEVLYWITNLEYPLSILNKCNLPHLPEFL